MKTLILYFFIFFAFVSPYSVAPEAADKSPLGKLSVGESGIRDLKSSNRIEVTKESARTLRLLNQKDLALSEYDKAREELRQFNRPGMGIVGNDQLSYREYQKKILGSSY